ncbi:MAG: RdgB/HAM1 family non-canonical purine NTP pyrophosphatase [Acidobacteriota bacterium]
MTTEKLLIGTTNAGKIEELRELFMDLPLEILGLLDLGRSLGDVEETGSTFTENAGSKASAYAVRSGLSTLADDSGIEVAALGNAPGVLSARYGGEQTGFDEKIRMLLGDVAAIPAAGRAARFVCVMSIAESTGKIVFTAEGVCDGKLAMEPRGGGGFGYDPIFVPNGHDLTFGELDRATKQQISHRARASAKIIRYLQGFYAL